MTSSVLKSDNLLEKLKNAIGMTDDGKEWVKICLDPYHDTPTFCRGYPDTTTGNSIVQCYKASSSVSCSSSITTGTWDCAFSLDPSPQIFSVATSSFIGSAGSILAVKDDQTSGVAWGGLQYDIYPTGTIYSPLASYGGGGLALPSTFTSGDYRIIGYGFEVINTTAELYKGGTVTVYRQSTPRTETACTLPITSGGISGSTTYGYGFTSVIPIPAPPSSIAAAMQLAGTLQWGAEKGVYVAATMNSTDNPVNSQFTPNPVYYYPSAVVSAGASNFAPIFARGQTGTPGGPFAVSSGGSAQAVTVLQPPVIDMSNFNACGAIFSGLTLQTTLTVNIRVYLERFPDVTQTDLVLLATPSPQYDPRALEFYSHAIREMPVGVPQGMNSLGSWFRGAIQTARDYVAPVLSVFGGPGGKLAGKAMYMAGAAADASEAKESRQGGDGYGAGASRNLMKGLHENALKSHFTVPKNSTKEVKKEIKKEAKSEAKKEAKKVAHKVAEKGVDTSSAMSRLLFGKKK